MTPDALAPKLRPELLKVFPAALLGRIVSIPYYPLSDEMLGGIVRLQLGRIAKRIARQPRRRFRLRRRRRQPHRFDVQRPEIGRAHDRQHHHQHAAAGAVARIPQALACSRAGKRSIGD